jgi:hypothetical protein
MFCAKRVERLRTDYSSLHSERFARLQSPAGELKDIKGERVIWDFLQRYDDSWIWRCIDHHTVTESTRNFAALEECVADAARHGYATQEHAQDSRSRRTRAKRGAAVSSR